MHTMPQSTQCSCQSNSNDKSDNSFSTSLNRIENAVEANRSWLKKLQGKSRCLLEDSTLHQFENGFGVASWAITNSRLHFVANGAAGNAPVAARLSFDTSFFDNSGKGKDKEVLWIDYEVTSPIPQTLRIPLRGVGVLRDPSSGNLLRCESFELATELVADVKDIAKIIACVLACVGLFCAAICAPLCIAIIACIACLATCVGANLPQFLVCVTACGVAVEGLEDALT